MGSSLPTRLRDATPIAATIVFFILGFAAHAWTWAWVVYLAVPLVYVLVPGDGRRRVDLRKHGDSA